MNSVCYILLMDTGFLLSNTLLNLAEAGSTMNQGIPREVMRDVFDIFDSDHDGKITKEDAERFVTNYYNGNSNAGEVRMGINKAVNEHGGALDFDQFVAYMEKTQNTGSRLDYVNYIFPHKTLITSREIKDAFFSLIEDDEKSLAFKKYFEDEEKSFTPEEVAAMLDEFQSKCD